jgi:hypothetical protein
MNKFLMWLLLQGLDARLRKQSVAVEDGGERVWCILVWFLALALASLGAWKKYDRTETGSTPRPNSPD